MRPNPGGILTGDAIIDREKEIDSIWLALSKDYTKSYEKKEL